MLIQLLMTAISFIGMTPQALGLPSEFWCQDYVSHVISETGQTGGGNNPGQVLANGVEFEAVPGGIAGFNVEHAPDDYTFHVAVIESVEEDGSVNVVEGNGSVDRTHVARNHYEKERITKTVITPQAHDEYLDGLCKQLQEVKPWIDWDC